MKYIGLPAAFQASWRLFQYGAPFRTPSQTCITGRLFP